MTTYIAEVRDASGKKIKEKVDATSPEMARSILMGKYPKIGKISKAGFELDFSAIESAMTSVSVKDKAVFSRQFAVMINAGVAIVRCLGILSEQCPNPKLKKALIGINAEVQQGVGLSDCMKRYPDCFDQLYVSMVEAGEVGGVLDEILNRLATLLEDMAKLTQQVKSAMTYPIAVGSLALIVFFAMTIFLIPIFAEIFEGIGTELPLLTQVMLNLSKFLRTWYVLIPIGAIIGAVFLIKQYYKTPVGRVTIDGLMLKLPIFGDIIEKNAVARFCRIFGTLTRSGVPILNSLDIVGDTVGNQVIVNAIEAAKADIQQGGMMSIAIDKSKVFPIMAIQMISIGEETGELDGMMMKVADFYESEVESAVKAMTSILEPMMMVVIAAMVGVILLSMYLPMFKVFETLG
jgi:type IV pilus assembly protein PilC